MKNKKKKKGINYASMKCPYCGGTVVYRSADGIYKNNHKNTMLYVCSNYPECDSYVRVHEGTNKPVGTLANAKLRALRIETHQYLEKVQRKKNISKKETYRWLAGVIMAPLSETHIGYLGEYYCNEIIKECKKVLYSEKNSYIGNDVYEKRGCVS